MSPRKAPAKIRKVAVIGRAHRDSVGRLLGNLDLQKGRQDELLQIYRKAAISAFADVENALDAIRQTAERERLQREVVTSSRRAFDISEQRLREGTVDLVTVLQTQQTLFQAEDALAQARLDLGFKERLGTGKTATRTATVRPHPRRRATTVIAAVAGAEQGHDGGRQPAPAQIPA